MDADALGTSLDGRDDPVRPTPTRPELFRTSIVGVGPFCVDFGDEIVTTRRQDRQRLIAAAPELLAALMAFAGCYGKTGEFRYHTAAHSTAELVEMARAAIAKATGT